MTASFRLLPLAIADDERSAIDDERLLPFAADDTDVEATVIFLGADHFE
jgi:hypothetical protein